MALLSLLFLAAPFVFGIIRAVTAHDYRMLLMALFAAIASILVRGFTRPEAPSGTLVVFVISTIVAAGVAYIMGATATAGIWPVALVFGFCNAAARVVAVRGRRLSRPAA
jgi:O-antigen/teichoic acid export membrane protein